MAGPRFKNDEEILLSDVAQFLRLPLFKFIATINGTRRDESVASLIGYYELIINLTAISIFISLRFKQNKSFLERLKAESSKDVEEAELLAIEIGIESFSLSFSSSSLSSHPSPSPTIGIMARVIQFFRFGYERGRNLRTSSYSNWEGRKWRSGGRHRVSPRLHIFSEIRFVSGRGADS